MSLKKIFLVFLQLYPSFAALNFFGPNCPGTNSNSNVVCVETGWVSGVPGDYYKNVTAFKGIPYAAAPTGNLRFRAPQPPNAWNGVRAASAYGSDCPQLSGNAVHGNEDCLFLNVWTASSSLTPLNLNLRPVYVFIHGGAYIIGSGSAPIYNGENLVNKGLVVVTINYRLGPLGFLSTPSLSAESGRNSSGNFGLMDQIAALQWVQRNIAAFGGDPTRVTIGGSSAGAASVWLLLLSPLATGLFQGAIAESGGLFNTQDPELNSLPAVRRTLANAEAFGVSYITANGLKDDPTVLRAASVQTLLNGEIKTDPAINPTTWNTYRPVFKPTLDGYVLARTYHETMQLGLQNDVPVLMGHNRDEWGASPQTTYTLAQYQAIVAQKYGNMSSQFLALYPASSQSEASNAANTAIRDNTRVSTYLWSQEWVKRVLSPVYTYFWNHCPPGTSTTTCASHGSEVIYFFGTLYVNPATPYTKADFDIADKMSSYVANFVARYNPNGAGLPSWPRVQLGQNTLHRVGDNFDDIAPADPFPQKLDFLQRFYSTQPVW